MASPLLELSPISKKHAWTVLLHRVQANSSGESVQYQTGTTHVMGRVHSTKLTNRILNYFLDMDAHKQCRDVVLVCAMKMLVLHCGKHVSKMLTMIVFIGRELQA